MFVYLNGLFLGLSLIIALGPQNVFLIKQGAQKNHAILSAVICFICDFILICSSIAGLHELLQLRPVLQIWMMVLGTLFYFLFRESINQRIFQAIRRRRKCTSTTQQDPNHSLSLRV